MPRGPKKKDKPEIKPIEGRPIPSDDLDVIGLEAFESVCDDLVKQGTLQNTDSKLIELYARTYALFKRAEMQLGQENCH